MWYLRYTLTYFAELCITIKNAHKACGFNLCLLWAFIKHEHNGHHIQAKYCANNKQPLLYCIDREEWLKWMNEDEPTLEAN